MIDIANETFVVVCRTSLLKKTSENYSTASFGFKRFDLGYCQAFCCLDPFATIVVILILLYLYLAWGLSVLFAQQ